VYGCSIPFPCPFSSFPQTNRRGMQFKIFYSFQVGFFGETDLRGQTIQRRVSSFPLGHANRANGQIQFVEVGIRTALSALCHRFQRVMDGARGATNRQSTFLKVLNFSFMPLGRFPGREGSEIPSLSSSRIFLTGIQAVLP